mgnify:CR=1 FL=1
MLLLPQHLLQTKFRSDQHGALLRPFSVLYDVFFMAVQTYVVPKQQRDSFERARAVISGDASGYKPALNVDRRLLKKIEYIACTMAGKDIAFDTADLSGDSINRLEKMIELIEQDVNKALIADQIGKSRYLERVSNSLGCLQDITEKLLK